MHLCTNFKLCGHARLKNEQSLRTPAQITPHTYIYFSLALTQHTKAHITKHMRLIPHAPIAIGCSGAGAKRIKPRLRAIMMCVMFRIRNEIVATQSKPPTPNQKPQATILPPYRRCSGDGGGGKCIQFNCTSQRFTESERADAHVAATDNVCLFLCLLLLFCRKHTKSREAMPTTRSVFGINRIRNPSPKTVRMRILGTLHINNKKTITSRASSRR